MGLNSFMDTLQDTSIAGITHSEVLTHKLKLYRRSITRERAASVHGITMERAKTSNVPRWEPIQLQHEYADMLTRQEWVGIGLAF